MQKAHSGSCPSEKHSGRVLHWTVSPKYVWLGIAGDNGSIQYDRFEKDVAYDVLFAFNPLEWLNVANAMKLF